MYLNFVVGTIVLIISMVMTILVFTIAKDQVYLSIPGLYQRWTEHVLIFINSQQ